MNYIFQCGYCISLKYLTLSKMCISLHQISYFTRVQFKLVIFHWCLMWKCVEFLKKFPIEIFMTKVTIFTHDWHSIHIRSDRGNDNEVAFHSINSIFKTTSHKTHQIYLKRKKINFQLFHLFFCSPFRNGRIFCRRRLWLI